MPRGSVILSPKPRFLHASIIRIPQRFNDVNEASETIRVSARIANIAPGVCRRSAPFSALTIFPTALDALPSRLRRERLGGNGSDHTAGAAEFPRAKERKGLQRP